MEHEILELYKTVQRVYKNALCARVLPMAWWTGMWVFWILHLVYKAVRDLPGYVHSRWHLFGARDPGAVQNCTAGVRKCRLHQSAPHGLVNWHVSCSNRTPSVRGAMGPPRLCTQPLLPVRSPRSRSCRGPYSGCTKMPFVSECSPWPCELACEF